MILIVLAHHSKCLIPLPAPTQYTCFLPLVLMDTHCTSCSCGSHPLLLITCKPLIPFPLLCNMQIKLHLVEVCFLPLGLTDTLHFPAAVAPTHSC